MKQVTYRTAALKALRKIPVNTAHRIVAKIDADVIDVIGIAPRGSVY